MKLEELIKEVNSIFSVEIQKKKRSNKYVMPRFIFMQTAKSLKFTLEEIGDSIGRHHTTVMNGIRKVNGFIETNDDVLREHINQLPPIYKAFFNFADGEIKRTLKMKLIKTNSLKILYATRTKNIKY